MISRRCFEGYYRINSTCTVSRSHWPSSAAAPSVPPVLQSVSTTESQTCRSCNGIRMGSFPRVHLQPPSVDFVETRMPEYHAAFRNSLTRYDPEDNQYKVHEENLAIMAAEQSLKPPESSSESSPVTQVTIRPLPPPSSATKFWKSVFPQSMSKFRNSGDSPEPIGRAESGYSIRNETTRTWDDVRTQLERAQEKYDGTKQGLMGRLKRGSRKIMEHGDGLRRIVQAMPDLDIASPIFAVAKVLLEVRCCCQYISTGLSFKSSLSL